MIVKLFFMSDLNQTFENLQQAEESVPQQKHMNDCQQKLEDLQLTESAEGEEKHNSRYGEDSEEWECFVDATYIFGATVNCLYTRVYIE